MEYKITLEEYCTSLFCSKLPKQRNESADGMLSVTPGCIMYNNISFEQCRRISIEGYRNIERSVPQYGDVLLSFVGSSCGKIVYFVKELKPTYLAQGFFILRCKDILHARWLFHFLQSPLAQNKIESRRQGSTIPYLSIKGMKDFEIDIPDEEQMKHKISILDSIIELQSTNYRKNRALEELYNTLQINI